MKNLFAILFFLIVLQASGQSFEGSVTWAVKEVPAGGPEASLTMKVKGTTIITTINGGMMNGVEMWFADNSTKVTRVMRPQKMFMVLPKEAMAAAEKSMQVSKVTKTTETTKILNYTCTKYTGEMAANGVTSKMSYWTTTEISDPAKVLAHQPDPFGNPKLPEGVEGVPLKIEKVTAGKSSVMEVSSIKREALKAEDFMLPADFKEMGK